MENNQNNENQEQIKDIEEIKETKKVEQNNEKFSIKEALSNKRIRYGAYASVMTLAVIAVVIVLNLVVGQLGIKFDLTKDKMYSLSDQTKQIVSALDKPVNIYAIYSTGSENTQFMEILDKYKTLSSNITVTTKDPNLNPQFTNQYVKNGGTIGEGSVIVESNGKFKVLSQYDLVDTTINYQTYQQEVTGIAVEPKVTGAIKYVTTKDLPVAYVVQGHNELEFNATAKQALSDENYEVKDLDVLTQGSVPQDTSILVINPPTRDYSKEEATMLTNYLVKGGRAIFVLNFYQNAMPNYESVLATYGVKPQNLPVVEGSATNALQNNPLNIIPNMEAHDITTPIKSNKLRVIIPQTQAVEALKEKGSNTKITPLLTTSNSAYAKKNINAKTAEKEDGDIAGPFNLAVLVEDAWFNDKTNYESKIIVISSSFLFDANQISSGANMDFFMNSVNYLANKKDSIAIRSKSLQTEYLSINQAQGLAILAVSVIVIPVVILAIGVTIWLRRRNK